jgi:hypothetical protein
MTMLRVGAGRAFSRRRATSFADPTRLPGRVTLTGMKRVTPHLRLSYDLWVGALAASGTIRPSGPLDA